MRRLELDETTEERIASTFKYLVIVAALATIPLTAAYWFEWEHWGFVVADWVVWTVFVLEYGFYLAISTDRWRTTKKMWLSVLIVIFSFPLLHEVLKSARLIRLVRPVPVLRQSMVLRQLDLMRLSNMRSAGAETGWQEVKLRLGEEHWITQWMEYLERLKSWAFTRALNMFRRKPKHEVSPDDDSHR